jgi:hypothetical protein
LDRFSKESVPINRSKDVSVDVKNNSTESKQKEGENSVKTRQTIDKNGPTSNGARKTRH